MKIYLILIFSLFILPVLGETQEDARAMVRFPQKIDHDDKTLTRNPSWKDKEIYLQANLDDDPDQEIVIGFIATYKPTDDLDLREDKIPYQPANKKYIPIIQNYAFYQIYDKGPDGYYKLVKTISGMDRPGRVEVVRLDEENPSALVVFGPGGERYMDLSIYQWREGGYRLIFNQASSSGLIQLDTQKTPPAISNCKISNTDGKEIKSCETFVWDAQDRTFRRAKEEALK